MGNQGKPVEGELIIPEAKQEEQEVEPEINSELIGQCMMMGMTENAAKHALYNTGNNNADMAVAWYFDNMDNPGKYTG